MLELMPTLDNTKNTPLYVQLYEYIKQEIENETIKPGIKLPSKRKLATHLGISQNTIQTAYEQLCAEGYAESSPRKGIFVTSMEDDLFHHSTIETKLDKHKDEKNKLDYLIDFNYGKVDLDYFPYSTWRKLTTQSLFLENRNILLLGEPQGEKYLREEISKYLFQSRGVKCSSEQVIIGAGTQFLLILLCMLIGRNHSYAIENPGFYRARQVFKDQGIDIQPISVDNDGICIEELKKSSAKVVYVTPSHQFPYGMVMPISRRIELLKLKVKNGMSEEDLIKTALNMKVKVYPTSIFYDNYENNKFPYVMLGFGGLKEMQIEEGIQILKKAWFI